jgi:hypothetical protein
MSTDRRSRESCFIFASDFGRAALDPTRELSGARTKDVSAMNEGSLARLSREEWAREWFQSCSKSFLCLRTEAMVPVIWRE